MGCSASLRFTLPPSTLLHLYKPPHAPLTKSHRVVKFQTPCHRLPKAASRSMRTRAYASCRAWYIPLTARRYGHTKHKLTTHQIEKCIKYYMLDSAIHPVIQWRLNCAPCDAVYTVLACHSTSRDRKHDAIRISPHLPSSLCAHVFMAR